MEEVLPQDIKSGKQYYVEYMGRVNDQGRTDSTKPHLLLKKYSGKIDEEDRGVLALRDAVQIQNGVKIPVVNNPFITIKPETPITFEEEQKRREGINYYYKFFPSKTDEINMRSVLRAYVDPDTARGLSKGLFGGKKRKTKRKKSKKRKTKKNKSKRKKV